MAGMGFFLGGLGTSFANSYNASAELALQKEHERNSQRRDLMVRADKDISNMWGVLEQTIQAGLAAGNTPEQIASNPGFGQFVDTLKQHYKLSGRDDSIVAPQLSLMFARPSAASMLNEGVGGAPQQPQQQSAQAGPSAFDQGGAAPAPFVGAQGQPSAQGAAGPAAPSVPAAAPPPQADTADFQRKFNQYTKAMSVAEASGSKAIYEAAKLRLQQLMHQHNDKVKIVEDKDAVTGEKRVFVVHPDEGRAMEIKLPPGKEPEGTTHEQSSFVQDGTLPPLNARAVQALDQIGLTPDQFDFEAQMVAFGNADVIKNIGGGSRDKASGLARRLISARAVEFWKAKGMSAEQANMTMVKFQAMKKGANTVANLESRMVVALDKAQKTAPVVVDLGKRINRTQYPSINEIILAAKKGSGDPDVVQFGIALETLASNYGSTLGMGNSVLTDFQTKRAQSLLERGYSQGQLEAAVQQMLVEIDREKAGTKQAMDDYLGTETTPSAAPATGGTGTGGWSIEEVK